MEISGFQELIEARYGEIDRQRGSSTTFLWFIEEVGELATALAGDNQANKREEFADVFAWLCTLANINGVDMEAAIKEKYIDYQAEGHK